MTQETIVANNGERQAAPRWSGIRADHLARYKLVETTMMVTRKRVLDIGSGCGYGAAFLARFSDLEACVAVEINPTAVAYAQEHYGRFPVDYRCGSAEACVGPEQRFDVITLFEVIEHVDDAPALLRFAASRLAPGGWLFCSTPNELRLPFDPAAYLHHKRHYTPAEFEALLNAAGLVVEQRWSNLAREHGGLAADWGGLFLIAAARQSAPSSDPSSL